MVVKLKQTGSEPVAETATVATPPANELPTAMATVMTKVASLQEYGNNPRNNDAAVPDMVKLIERFGFRVPILKKGTRIVDGHLRVKAARKMGIKEVPAIDVGNMSAEDERALRIALNKSVEWAEWDQSKLKIEFDFLDAKKLDLGLTGFGTSEIAKITKDAAAAIAAASQKLNAPTKSKDADAGKPADPNYVTITFTMASTSRDTIMEVLESVRKRDELGNMSQALVVAMKEVKNAMKG